jgi:hypothetical protein
MTETQDDKVHLIRKAIGALEDKLHSPELKGTAADLARLLQMEKELTPELPHEVRVQWVDSSERTSSTKR